MNSRKKPGTGKPLVLVAVLALIGGVAMGYGIRAAMDRDLEIPDEAKEVVPLTVVSPAKDAGGEAEVAALRARIRELEARREGDGRMERPDEEGEAPETRRRPPEGRRPEGGTNAPPRARRFSSPQEWMENLKKENPERYAEIVKHSQEMRQRMKERNQTRDEFLAGLVTDKSSDALKANHEKLVETLAVVEEYQERMGPDSEDPLTEEERRAFWEASRSLRQLMEVERRGALEELGVDYGEDGSDFADYIEAIYQNTNSRWPMGGPPPGGRGNREGGGRREGGSR